MQKCTKKGTMVVLLGVALCLSAFAAGVNVVGIVLMAVGIMTAGFGAGKIMDSPCAMLEK